MKPGIVIAAAMLNFISAAFSLLWSVLCAAAILFGNTLGVLNALAGRIQEVNVALSVNVVLGFVLAVTLAVGLFYIWLGVGLLKGKGAAWYLQVAASLIGLLFFPIGTVVNGVILAFFFTPAVRSYFKV